MVIHLPFLHKRVSELTKKTERKRIMFISLFLKLRRNQNLGNNQLIIPREARYQIPVVRAPFVNPVPVRVRGMNSSQSKFFWPSFMS